MQMQLPIFPTDTKLINATLGVREQDDTVYYLHNGNPICCHKKDDMQNFRFTCGLLVSTGLCILQSLLIRLG